MNKVNDPVLKARGSMLRLNTGSVTIDLIDTESGTTIISGASFGINEIYPAKNETKIKILPNSLEINSIIYEGRLDFNLTISVDRARKGFLFVTTVKNLSPGSIKIKNIIPFIAGQNQIFYKSRAFIQGYSTNDKCDNIFLPYSGKSYWFSTIDNSLTCRSLLTGFVTFRTGTSFIEFNKTSFTAKSDLENISLPTQKQITGNTFFLAISENSVNAAEIWSETACGLNPRKTAISGPLYIAGFNVTGKTEIKNEIAAIPEDFSAVIIESGYQITEGEWSIPNAAGNLDIPSLIKTIGNARKGLWIAPFLVSKNSTIYKIRPEWLVKDKNKKPLPVTYGAKALFCLDTTNINVQKWLSELFKMFREQWGANIFLVSGLSESSVKGKRSKHVTGAQALGTGIEIIKEAAGNALLISENVPIGTGLELIDGCLVPQEIYPESAQIHLHKKNWTNIYNGKTNFSGPEISEEMQQIKRRSLSALISLTQSGIFQSSKENPKDILRNSIPLDTAAPSIQKDVCNKNFTTFNTSFKNTIGIWHVYGIKNDADHELFFDFSPSATGMRKKAYLVYDISNNIFLGKTNRNIKIKIAAGELILLCVRTALDYPQLAAGGINFSQGYSEIENYNWDGKYLEFSTVLPDTGAKYSIYIPERYSFAGLEINGDGNDDVEHCLNGNILELMKIGKGTFNFRISFAKSQSAD